MRVAGCIAAVLVLLPPTAAGAAEPQPFGTVSARFETASYATHFDPLTLAPVGPRVELGEYHGGWSFSPDGRRVAFGKSPAGRNTHESIRIVDVASVTLEQTALAPAFIGGLAWLAPRTLVGLLEDEVPMLFDPSTGEVIRRLRPLRSCGTRPVITAGARMVALEPGGLVALTARGVVRHTAISRVPRQCFRAALTVEGDGRSAWVAVGRHLTRVDLGTMRVTTPALPAPRLRGGSDRLAILAAGRGALVIAHQSVGGIPRGVELVNTRSGAREILTRAAGGVRLARGLVLTYNAAVHRPGDTADGVRIFGPDGRLRHRLLRGRTVEDLEVYGSRAYAISSNQLWTIDVRSGRVLARSAADPVAQIDLLEP